MFETAADEIAVVNAKKRYGAEDSVYMNTLGCAYVNGFQDGAKYVYDRLREEQLKDVERTMDKVLNVLESWKPEAEEI